MSPLTTNPHFETIPYPIVKMDTLALCPGTVMLG
jgi:hypothetical protein